MIVLFKNVWIKRFGYVWVCGVIVKFIMDMWRLDVWISGSYYCVRIDCFLNFCSIEFFIVVMIGIFVIKM